MTRVYDLTAASLPSGVTTTVAGGGAFSRTTGVGVTIGGTGTLAQGSVPSFYINDSRATGSGGLGDETNPKTWLAITMSTTSGSYVIVALTNGTDTYRYATPIRPDGVMHTYNMWIGQYYLIPQQPRDLEIEEATGDHPAEGILSATPWSKYRIRATHVTSAGFDSPIRIYGNEVNGTASTAVVEQLEFALQPRGDTILVVERMCPARAMNRVSVANTMGVRVRNGGGITATGIEIAFDAGDGLTFSNVRTIPDSIPPDCARTFYFDLSVSSVSPTTGAFVSFGATISCTQGDSTHVTSRVWIDPPRPSLASVPNGVIPTPVPIPAAQRLCKVSCWFFPGWDARGQTYSNVSAFERRPELGYYDQNTTPPASWSILWAVNHGIECLVEEWIDGVNVSEPHLDAFLASPFISFIKFSICHINNGGMTDAPAMATGPSPPTGGANNEFYLTNDTTPQRLYGPKLAGAWPSAYIAIPSGTNASAITKMRQYLDMMRRQLVYFRHASYRRESDGRIVFGLFKWQNFYDHINGGSSLPRTAGRDAFAFAAMARLEAFVIDNVAGSTGISWEAQIADDSWATAAGIERSTIYGWAAWQSANQVVTAQAHRNFAEKAGGYWTTAFANSGTPTGCVPSTAADCGYDARYWLNTQDPTWIVTGWTYEQQKLHFQAALDFVNNPANNIPAARREIRVTAWDEYGEGHALSPMGQTQFKWLQALREVIAPTWTPPANITPRDVALTVPNCITTTAPFGPARWVAFPVAYPAEDENTNTTEGVRIPFGSYPAVEPAKIVNGATWTMTEGTPTEPPPSILPWRRARGASAGMTAERLRTNNINTLRIAPGVTWNRVGGTTVYNPVIDFVGFESRMNALPPGVRIMIDPHHCPGTRGGTIFADDALWTDINFHYNLAEYWRQIGRRWATWDRVAGYDIMNEPQQPVRPDRTAYPVFVTRTADLWTPSFWSSLYAQYDRLGWVHGTSGPSMAVGDRDPRSWRGLAELCRDAIRENDRRHTIICEACGSGGRGGATGIDMGPYADRTNNGNFFMLDDINWVFSPHFYHPREYNLTPDNGLQPPTSAQITEFLQPVRTFQLANPGLQIVVGEWGSLRENLNLPLYATRMCDILESYGWSWMYFTVNYTGGSFDASVVPDLMTVLRSYWALNPDIG